MIPTIHTPGKLVRYRGRTWIVIPSHYPETVMLRPLGGSDQEICGVYLPLRQPGEEIMDDSFPNPRPDERGDFQTAKLLFDASRLSFRNASGPFRCMGKLSFEPRSYQVVPLVMALKQDITRLLIADDVGIGKTIEALIILKELLERGEIRRFAVICPPHLCEQWQQELNDKLDIQAEIIRSSTAAALDRLLPDDSSIFYHIPYQVISIDYLKTDKRKDIFLQDCPELIIVDEAHTCALPSGAKTRSQQQRYHLLHQISKRENQHLLLLTATPHSGKNEEFQSILGLLQAEFENYSIIHLSRTQREKLARYFIQRKRDNIKKWAGQETHFPERDAKEIGYLMSMPYLDLYHKALLFARGLASSTERDNRRKVRYWAALALLRGIMSSPAAGIKMLENRKMRRFEEDGITEIENPLFETDSFDTDVESVELLNMADLQTSEIQQLDAMKTELAGLQGVRYDVKIASVTGIIRDWVAKGFHPIIFCRFIATAHYVHALLSKELDNSVKVRVVTSELADEQRKEEVEKLGLESKRVLVATDCLSEGINLQEYFTAVLHYDLPWNPNRLEQREGRVDRFGQDAKEIKAYLIWGENNPIDAIVLKILIQKVRDIQKSIGVSIPLGENNKSIMDAVLDQLLTDPASQRAAIQTRMEFADQTTRDTDHRITTELEAAKENALHLRSIFAHSSISQEDIQAQLLEVNEAIGDIKSVENFVLDCLVHLGASWEIKGPGYKVNPTNLPPHLKKYLEGRYANLISFASPTHKGYQYIGRNHQFTEQLCQYMLALAFEPQVDHRRVARMSVIRSHDVHIKTTLVLFRVRNVIKESNSHQEVIAEEMYLWGYEGSDPAGKKLDYPEAKALLKTAHAAMNLPDAYQQESAEDELNIFDRMREDFQKLAEERAENLVNAHGRFRNLVGGRRYEKVYPILPPDMMGIYIIHPVPKEI